jgi:hypothetical protein
MRHAIEAEIGRLRINPWDQLGYTPTPKQQQFHRLCDDGVYDILFGGAAGPGKTMGLLMEAAKEAWKHPGIRILAVRNTYDELEESFFPKLEKQDWWADLGVTWNGTIHQLRFQNGSRIRFRHLEGLKAANRRQGGEYQLLLCDELCLLPPTSVEILMERLRSSDPNIPVIGVRAASNPGGPGHSRAKARYFDATANGAKIAVDADGFSIGFVPARAEDNPHLDDRYLAVLDAIKDPARRAAMRDGNWNVHAGQFFESWNTARHVVPTVSVPPSWKTVCGIDWGYTNPWAVVWVGFDEDDRAWVPTMLYGTQVGETDQANRVDAAEESHGLLVSTRYADPAMWAARGDADAIATVYDRAGVRLEKANNARVIGASRVREYLADGPACAHHRALGWETCPRLHVAAQCADLIRTLPELQRSRTNPEDVDTTGEDHAYDALRYALMGGGSADEVYDIPVNMLRALGTHDNRIPVRR